MPTYVYACAACGKQFEQFQSFKEDPLSVCRCGAEGKVRRVIQPIGVVFKGSGWYINDSRSASSTKAASESPKLEQAEASEKPEQVATSEKPEKAEKPEKPEKATEKPATSEKAPKPATSEKSTKSEPSSASSNA